MACCCHGGKLSVLSSLSNIQLACNNEWVVAPIEEKSFAAWNLSYFSENPVVFSGHKKPVTALCFGNKPEPILLASGSEDYVIIWVLEKKFSGERYFCEEIRSLIIAKNLGYVQHISFSTSDELISVCVGKEVWVIEVQSCTLKTVIEDHNGIVNASKFSPEQDSLLVTISEDRTFKVCDVEQKSVLYHSAIISAYPFLSLAFHSSGKEVSLGSSDGMVRVFSLNDRYECLRVLDLNKFFAQHLLLTDRDDNSELRQDEAGLAVIGLCYNCPDKNLVTDNMEYHATSELLQDADSLICATTSAMFVLNMNTCQPMKIVDFREQISSSIDQLSHSSLVSFCGSCEFFQQHEKVICVLGSLFENSLHVINISLSSKEEERGLKSVPLDCSELSVLSKAPLSEKSPLKAELVPKLQDKTAKRSTKKDQTTARKTRGILEDQPVTFKKKIRSSGYTSLPRAKMFSPKLNPVKQSKTQFPPKAVPKKSLSSSMKESKPAEDYSITTELREKLSLCSVPVAVNQVKFSANGKKIACALANHTAHVLDIPLTSKQRVYTGHNGAVQSVDFSNDGQYLLTSSNDNTACMWATASSDPVLAFKHQNQAASTASKDNPNFSKGVNNALFYYVDKFVLLSSGNSVFMYKYYLDFTKDDLKRYQSRSHYKLVTSLPLENAQNITAFSCINGFYSYIVLCAGSDRSLKIFDMNINRSLRRLEDVHTRNVHCIKMNEGSKTYSIPSQSYDLFITAAISDGVKIWDLRNTRCVRKYEGHVNRSHPLGVSWSPCAKYFAVGSEDKSTYIYDIRHSSPCERLSKHSDVVFDVAFHPCSSQLVTATLDGKLHFY